MDGSIPQKFWESRKNAYAFNEYKVVDEDGEEFIEQGIQKRIGLTPEQWVIVKEMQELVKQAKEAGIKFLWDRDYCGTVKAMNMQHVCDLGYDIMATDGGSLVNFNDCCFASTDIEFFDYNGDDPCYSISLLPTEREKKLWQKAHPENK